MMKRFITTAKAVSVFIAVSAALASLVSCGKEKGNLASPAVTEPQPESAPVLKAVPKNTTVNSVVIYDGAALWTRNGDTVNWADSIALGTFVPAVTKGDSAEKITAKRSSDGKEREFYHIIVDEKDFWIQDCFLAVGVDGVAVVKEEAAIYNDCNIDSITKKTVAAGTIVGFNYADDSNYVNVTWYNDGFFSKYIKAGRIEEGRAEVYVTLLNKRKDVVRAEKDLDPGIKNAILDDLNESHEIVYNFRDGR